MRGLKLRIVVVLGCILLTGLAVWILPRVKQLMLPQHATPDTIEALFGHQIQALVDVATHERSSEEVKGEFSHPAIQGAFVVTQYGDSVRSLIQVRAYTPEYDRATRSGAWFQAVPRAGDPVVNICGGQVATYERVVPTSYGKRGLELSVSVDYLKQHSNR